MDDIIKLVRLQSGEDIIASIHPEEGGESVTLDNPMTVIFKRLPTGRAVMMMAPWLPIELIEVNSATLYTADILTIVEPKASMIQYYSNAVDEAHEIMNDTDDEVEDALTSGRNDANDSDFMEQLSASHDEENDDEEDFELDRMNEILKGTGSKKKLLH
jgi:hypothetical protein